MRRIIKIAGIVIIIVFIAYAGMCTYSNFFAKSEIEGNPELPKINDAAYSLVVKNTGTVILTNSYEQFGDRIGERTFALHGYWELVGMEFQYRNSDIILSEQVFGEITIKKR